MSIYLVTQQGGKPRLVEARQRNQAISHVARDTFEAKPVSLKEVYQFAKEGLELETASAEAAAEEQPEGK